MGTMNGFGLSRIGQISCARQDIDRAVDLLTRRLGIPFLFQVRRWLLPVREVRLLPPSGAGVRPSLLGPYFTVEDLDRRIGRGGARVAFPRRAHLIHRAEDHDSGWRSSRQRGEHPRLMAQRPKS